MPSPRDDRPITNQYHVLLKQFPELWPDAQIEFGEGMWWVAGPGPKRDLAVGSVQMESLILAQINRHLGLSGGQAKTNYDEAVALYEKARPAKFRR